MSNNIELIFRDNMQEYIDKIKKSNPNAIFLSHSKLGTFAQCPRSYYYSYIDRKPQTTGVYSTLGSEVHDTLQELYEDRTDVLDKSKFDKAFEMCELLGVEFPQSQYDIAGNYKKDIDNFYKYYQRIPKEDGRRFICELGFILQIDENHYEMGYIDLLILNPDGTAEIVDFKTSSTFSGSHLIEAGRQLILYKLAIEQLYNIPVTRVSWQMVKYIDVQIGNNKPKIGLKGRDWVKACSSQIKTLLKKELGDEMVAEIMLLKAVAENSIESLPQNVQDKIRYNIQDREYKVTQDLIDEFWEYTRNSIKAIESKEQTIDNFECKCDDFFCRWLCGFSRDYCNEWKK